MKPRTLLVLAIVVAALGAFIWFVERDLPSTDERGERARKLLPIDADEVSAIEIHRDGGVTRLERVRSEAGADGAEEEDALSPPPADEWRLVEPMAARADAGAVDALLDRLTGLEKERTLEDVDPAALGLAEPRATVTLTVAGQERSLSVGERVPASSNVIVGLSGAAFVVSDAFWQDVEKPGGDWRSREAFAAGRDEIVGVRLRGTHEVALERGDDGFRLTEPFVDEASSDRVDELLGALTDLEIEAFLDGPLDTAALGLDPAAATLEVTLQGDAEPVEVRLGIAPADAEAERYVALGGQMFTAETELAELVELEPGAWRSTAWTRRQVYEVDAVEVRRGDTTLRLERVDGDWLRDGEEIGYTAASDVLYALRDAEARAVVQRAAVELAAEPLYEITLTADEGSEVLRLYAETADGYPAERQGRDSVLLLAPEAVGELVAKIEAAQRAAPVPAPDADETADPGGD